MNNAPSTQTGEGGSRVEIFSADGAQPSYRTEISTAPNIAGIQGVAEHLDLVNLTGLTFNSYLH